MNSQGRIIGGYKRKGSFIALMKNRLFSIYVIRNYAVAATAEACSAVLNLRF